MQGIRKNVRTWVYCFIFIDLHQFFKLFFDELFALWYSCRTISPKYSWIVQSFIPFTLVSFKPSTLWFGCLSVSSCPHPFCCLSHFFFPSLVSLWILGPEHSWVLTLAKGDPLRRRSMLAHGTICLHCSIPPLTPIKPLDWMKVFLTCMAVLSQSLCHSGHSLKNRSSNQKVVQCMRVCYWPMQCLFDGLHIMVLYVSLFIPILTW